MIAPEKFSKSLAKNKFKIGISMKELVPICMIIPTCSLIGINEIYSYGATFLIFLGAIIKNLFFEPKYFVNTLERKSHFKWERVKVRIDD